MKTSFGPPSVWAAVLTVVALANGRSADIAPPVRISTRDAMAMVVRYRVPSFPNSCRKQSLVIADISVDGTGRVVAISITRSTDLQLSETTEVALRGWRFQPATIEGIPHPMRTRVFVYFKREGSSGVVLIPGVNDMR